MTSSSSNSEPRVLAVGFDKDLIGCHVAKIFSTDTLKGYDLIIFHAREFLRVEGHGNLSGHLHQLLGERMAERVDVIMQQVAQGAALVVHPAVPDQARKAEGRVYDDQKKPFLEAWRKIHLGIGLKPERGTQFEAKNEPFDRFLKAVSSVSTLTHYVCLDPAEDSLLGLSIPNSNDLVACAYRFGNKKGLLLFLPEPGSQLPELLAFREAVWQLVQDLRKKWPEMEKHEAMPAWADDYLLPNEETFVEQMKEANERIEQLAASRDDLQVKLQERRRVKRLVTAHGKDLERAVEGAFVTFEFRVKRPDNRNRTDRIAWNEDRAVVMEIKGRTKGANANNLGQVMRWKSEFYEEHSRVADAALLVINGWREIPIEERADKLVFEPNIVKDAEREKIGLITGVQLLALRIAVENGELDTGQVREKIFGCVGLFQGYDTITRKSSNKESTESS